MLKTGIHIIFFLFPAILCFAQEESFKSELPLVFINTEGQNIPDEPKLIAEMGIIWNGPGEENRADDPYNHYNGKVGIEIRGSSSQMFPKKSFSFETRDEQGEDMDFPVLGLPEEEDWILYAPYSDKTLIRNVLTFSLAKPLGRYASRCRFVELFLNGNYQGLYVLMEKIKRESTRVDIATLNPDETAGTDLTGGYIIKIDKTTGSGGGGWRSQYSNANGKHTFYQYEEPEDDEIVPVQEDYIQNYVNEFEKAVFNKYFEGDNSYRNYADVGSFIDFILISELTKNVDAYRLSTFLHKDKNGKLNAGPIWDFNLAYGNADYYKAWLWTGFQINGNLQDDYWSNPFWWLGMWGDRLFINQMKCRWAELREGPWSDERIMEVTDSLINQMGEAIDRNFERWPVLGKYIWPNYYIGSTYQEEVNWMKDWIDERLNWLDSNLPGECGGDVPPLIDEFSAVVYPNPFDSEIKVEIASDVNITLTLQLYNSSGMLIKEVPLPVVQGEQTFPVNSDRVPRGIYFYRLIKGFNVIQNGKLVKY